MKTPFRLVKLAGFVAIWGGLVFGATQLHTAELPLDDCTICGPWGCGPPVKSLIGAHALWTSLLAPLVGLVCRVLAGPRGSRLALACLAVGGCLLVGLFGFSAVAWLRAHGAEHAVQKGLFTVAITPDAMGLPLLAGGAFGWLAARKSRRMADMHDQPVESGAAGRENLAV